MVELFDAHGVSFVAVTQQFNTSTSMGRLTLNVLLSLAQFEREVTGESIRDKVAASKAKCLWMGGTTPLGYDAHQRRLISTKGEAATVRLLYELYLQLGSVRLVGAELDRCGLVSEVRVSKAGVRSGANASSTPSQTASIQYFLRRWLKITTTTMSDGSRQVFLNVNRHY